MNLTLIFTGLWYVGTGGSLDYVGITFFLIISLSYLLPFALNWKKIEIGKFLLGLLSLSFLAPTYVNIFSVYSIFNVHDVTWGNRPTIMTEKFKKETK